MIKKITSLNDFYKIIKNNDVVLVDFSSKFCGPCKLQERELEQLDRQYNGKIKIISIDINEHPKIAMKYGIMATPTLMFFKRGKRIMFKSRTQGRIDRFIGLRKYEQLIGPINYLISL